MMPTTGSADGIIWLSEAYQAGGTTVRVAIPTAGTTGATVPALAGDKVTVSVKDNVVVVKGPKGELSKPFPKEIGVVADAKVVNVTDLTEVKDKVSADYTEGERRKKFIEQGKAAKAAYEAKLKAGETLEQATAAVAANGVATAAAPPIVAPFS